jgi:hypothetical protein
MYRDISFWGWYSSCSLPALSCLDPSISLMVRGARLANNVLLPFKRHPSTAELNLHSMLIYWRGFVTGIASEPTKYFTGGPE